MTLDGNYVWPVLFYNLNEWEENHCHNLAGKSVPCSSLFVSVTPRQIGWVVGIHQHTFWKTGGLIFKASICPSMTFSKYPSANYKWVFPPLLWGKNISDIVHLMGKRCVNGMHEWRIEPAAPCEWTTSRSMIPCLGIQLQVETCNAVPLNRTSAEVKHPEWKQEWESEAN